MYFTEIFEIPRTASSTAQEELEILAPSKLAIENVSKTFKAGTGLFRRSTASA